MTGAKKRRRPTVKDLGILERGNADLAKQLEESEARADLFRKTLAERDAAWFQLLGKLDLDADRPDGFEEQIAELVKKARAYAMVTARADDLKKLDEILGALGSANRGHVDPAQHVAILVAAREMLDRLVDRLGVKTPVDAVAKVDELRAAAVKGEDAFRSSIEANATMRELVEIVKPDGRGLVDRVRFIVEDRQRTLDERARLGNELSLMNRARLDAETATAVKGEEVERLEHVIAEQRKREAELDAQLEDAREGLNGASRFIASMGRRSTWG